MFSLMKGLVLLTVGAVLLFPAGILFLALGVPVFVIGAVVVGLIALAGVMLALPVIILGALAAALIAAAFGVSFAVLGVTIVAMRLVLPFALLALAVVAYQRWRAGDRRRTRPQPVTSGPVRDRYEVEAERELDRDLGIQ